MGMTNLLPAAIDRSDGPICPASQPCQLAQSDRGKPCRFWLHAHKFYWLWLACMLTGVCNSSSVVWCSVLLLRRNTEQQRTQQAFTSCRVLGRRSTIVTLNSITYMRASAQ